jgi:phage-related protein
VSYQLIFYSSVNSKPIQDFIVSTEKVTQAKILKSLDLVEIYGVKAGMPHVKKITKDLFELRVRGKQEVRLLFVQKGKKTCFLHGFLKKTNKIPKNEIKTALKRLTLV